MITTNEWQGLIREKKFEGSLYTSLVVSRAVAQTGKNKEYNPGVITHWRGSLFYSGNISRVVYYLAESADDYLVTFLNFLISPEDRRSE
jgi:hypothetical protein